MSAADQLLKALRNTLSGGPKPSPSDAEAMSHLLEAIDRADQQHSALRTALSTTRTAGAQQVSDTQSLSDQARLLLTRARDMRGALQPIREALERSKLAALNAGLQGSRLDSSVGQAITAMAEEVRVQVAQGLEALDEHAAMLEQADRDRERLREYAEQAHEGAASIKQFLDDALEQHTKAGAALERIASSLHQLTETDPEVIRLIASATEHTRGLLQVLTRLSSRGGRALAVKALAPLIERLLGTIDELYRSSNPPGKAP